MFAQHLQENKFERSACVRKSVDKYIFCRSSRTDGFPHARSSAERGCRQRAAGNHLAFRDHARKTRKFKLRARGNMEIRLTLLGISKLKYQCVTYILTSPRSPADA